VRDKHLQLLTKRQKNKKIQFKFKVFFAKKNKEKRKNPVFFYSIS